MCPSPHLFTPPLPLYAPLTLPHPLLPSSNVTISQPSPPFPFSSSLHCYLFLFPLPPFSLHVSISSLPPPLLCLAFIITRVPLSFPYLPFYPSVLFLPLSPIYSFPTSIHISLLFPPLLHYPLVTYPFLPSYSSPPYMRPMFLTCFLLPPLSTYHTLKGHSRRR